MLTIVRMARLVVEQRRLAITDELTGLHTRRFLEAQLPIEVARARRSASSLAVFIADIDHFKSINDRHGHPAGDRALTEIGNRLLSVIRPGDVLARYGGEEFALLAPNVSEPDLAAIAERLRGHVGGAPVALSPHKSVTVTISVGAAAYPLHARDLRGLVAVADRALYAAKAGGRDRAVVGSSDTAMAEYLQRVADDIDGRLSPHEHSAAVARWTRCVAAEFGLDDGAISRAELAGRLHDIGKAVVPEAILSKPDRLTEQEWALIRQHVDHGYRLAGLVPGFSDIAEIIRQHHERYDGAGYPDRLRGTEIRLEARIIAVCDSYAAMRADRAYQSALSEEKACAELRAGRHSQFDPDVVRAFLDLHQRGRLSDLRPLRRSALLPR